MRGESERRRDDRRLREVTTELRVILPGTTVIFAFLLTVPFSAGWGELRNLERNVYFVAFLASALAIVLLVGESAYHRLRGEPYDKANLVRRATRQTIGALALVSIALGAVVFVVGSVVYGRELATIASSTVLAAAFVTWFAYPLLRRWTAPRRLEQRRLEQRRLEQRRLEQRRLEQRRLEQRRLERERAEHAAEPERGPA